MTLSQGLRQVADAVDALREEGLVVEDVAIGDGEPDGELAVDLRVAIPAADGDCGRDSADASAGDATSPSGVSVARQPRTDGSGVRAVGGVDAPVRGGDGGDTAATPGTGSSPASAGESRESAVDRPVQCPVDGCDATFESDHGMKVHRTKVHLSAGDEDLPAYRDPERLAEVYEECDSFTEMRAALETDVSAQTVRRQTIAHGIHDPTADGVDGDEPTNDDVPADDAVEDEPVDDDVAEGDLVDAEPVDAEVSEDGAADDEKPDRDERADGDDGPAFAEREVADGTTVGDLVAAVDEGKTLYDVQGRLGLDREASMALLDEFDLLWLVHGRVADRDLRAEVDAADIEESVRRQLDGETAGDATDASA